MFQQLTLATLMVVAVVGIHLVGLAILTRLLRSNHRLLKQIRVVPFTLLLGATLGLIGIHTVEIWIYAALYLALGAFAHFEQALYFSTITYTTIGYGDVLIASNWRILGAIEGAIGIIMLGWSTAFLVSLLTQLKLLSHDWIASGTPKEQEK